MNSRMDINRLEHQTTITEYKQGADDGLNGAKQTRQGLFAIAYAIADLADAMRNPSWAPDPEYFENPR